MIDQSRLVSRITATPPGCSTMESFAPVSRSSPAPSTRTGAVAVVQQEQVVGRRAPAAHRLDAERERTLEHRHDRRLGGLLREEGIQRGLRQLR